MRQLVITLACSLALMQGCVYVPAIPGMTGAANVQPPVIASFEAVPDVLSAGGRAALNWTVTGAQSVSIDNGIGPVALKGTRTVMPDATTVYLLTASSPAGTVTATARVLVTGAGTGTAAPLQPVINSFTVTPPSIYAGGSASLGWSISNATSATLSQGIGSVNPVSGTQWVSPAATTTYVLTAVNGSGSVSQGIVVVVSGAGAGQTQGERLATLNLIQAESGSLIKSSANYTRSGAVCAGDNSANLASRAFLSFDLTSLPPAARITEAVLDFTGTTSLGNPSYSISNWGNMGALEVYQVQYGLPADLDRIAYESTASRVGSLQLTDAAVTPPQLDVTRDSNGNNVVQQLMDGVQSRCQFRLQFFTSTNWDSKADQICLEGAVLRVKYTLP